MKIMPLPKCLFLISFFFALLSPAQAQSCDSLMVIGGKEYSNKNYRKALIKGKEACFCGEINGNPDMCVRGLTLQGLAFACIKKNDSAQVCFDKARKLVDQAGKVSPDRIAKFCKFYSQFIFDTGDFLKARTITEQGLKALMNREQDEKVKKLIGELMFFNANSEFQVGNYFKSKKGFNRAKDFFSNIQTKNAPLKQKLRSLIGDCEQRLSRIYRRMGHYNQANAHIERAMEIFKSQPAKLEKLFFCLQDKGLILGDAGYLKEEEAIFRKWLADHDQQTGALGPDLGTIHQNLGRNQIRQGRYAEGYLQLDQAELFFKKAFPASHQKFAFAKISRSMGLRLEGKSKKAIPLLDDAIEILKSQEKTGSNMAIAHLQKAYNLDILKDYQGALGSFEKARNACFRTGKDQLEIEKFGIGAEEQFFQALTGEASLYEKLYAQKKGRANLEKATELYYRAAYYHLIRDQKRLELGFENLIWEKLWQRGRFAFEKAIDLSYEIQQIDQDSKWLSKAFTLSDHSRSHKLKKNQAFRFKTDYQGEGAKWLREKAVLIEGLRGLQDFRLRTQIQNNKLKVLKIDTEIELMKKALEEINEKIRKNPSLQWAALDVISIDKITKTLLKDQPGKLIIESFQSGQYTYLFYLVEEKSSWKRIPNSDFQSEIRQYSRYCSSKPKVSDQHSENLAIGYSIAKKILPGNSLPNRIKELLIIPDGSLAQFPFAALPLALGYNATGNLSKPHFLAKQIPISYDYSLGLKLMTPSSRNIRLAEGISFHLSEKVKINSNLTLHPIPNTNETAPLDNFLNLKTIATLDQLKLIHNLKQNHFAHLSTHLIDLKQNGSKKEELIRLLLVLGKGQFLRNMDVYQTNLSNLRLLVLGTCESAKGNEQAGEGILSMTHAFRTAGGQSVVSCLWEATTSQLAVIHKEMYAYLVNRKTLAEAVQLAQKDYLASERPEMTRHPYYWAHLVVNGYSGAFEFRD